MSILLDVETRKLRMGRLDQHQLAEYERCLEIYLEHKILKKCRMVANDLGIRNSWGREISENTFYERCMAAFLSNPDKWRERVEASSGMSVDDEGWNLHVISNAVSFPNTSVRWRQLVVFDLLRSDPERWKPYKHLWEGRLAFRGFEL